MRNVLQKLMTAMRGSVNELGEAVVDKQGNRILEQELRDSEQELKQAKQELASLMAEVASLSRQINTEEEQIGKREADAGKALNAGQEDLAREVAERIVGHQRRAAELTEARGRLQERVVHLKERMLKAENVYCAPRRRLIPTSTATSRP